MSDERECSPGKLFEGSCIQFHEFKRTGGGGGIRTPETLSGLTVFKTAGFNRSPTPPFLILTYSVS